MHPSELQELLAAFVVAVVVAANMKMGPRAIMNAVQKLKRMDKLYQLYPEIEHFLPSFLKLHKALKKRGLNPQNTESFVDLIELSIVKLPELQDQYQNLQSEVQGLQYNLQDMQDSDRCLKYNQQRIMEQTDALNTLQQTFDTSVEKVSNLYKEKYWLEQSLIDKKNVDKK